MSYLYSVYQHPSKGCWGFTEVIDGAVHTAAVGTNGHVTLGKVEPIKLGPELQLRVRGGYARVTQPKYLHRILHGGNLTGEFVVQHPDLGRELQGECLLFAAVPAGLAIAETVQQWDNRLSNCEPSPGRDAWLLHCLNVTAYVPAMSSDVAAVLLVAQWANENQLILVANSGKAPTGAPSERRHNWRAFLTEWFDQSRIDQALTDLGWPLAEGLSTPPAETTTPPEGNWLQLSQQVSF